MDNNQDDEGFPFINSVEHTLMRRRLQEVQPVLVFLWCRLNLGIPAKDMSILSDSAVKPDTAAKNQN